MVGYVRFWAQASLRMLVTGGPPVLGGGGMPQRLNPEFLRAVWSIATLFNQLMTLVVRSSSSSVLGKPFGVIAGCDGAALFSATRRLVGSRSDFAKRG